MEVKLLRVEKFSNKNFFIEIELYEHNLAKGRCEVKREGKRRQKNWWKSPITSPLLYFPSYLWISIAEWEEFYEKFRHDKTARRWVRRVMRHSFDGFLSPDGRIDHTKFAIENDRREHKSREYYRMNKEQLLLMKKLLPGFSVANLLLQHTPLSCSQFPVQKSTTWTPCQYAQTNGIIWRMFAVITNYSKRTNDSFNKIHGAEST